ncbi:MAG: hypothetical protein KDD68_03830 [Bdellovibrionales bacterium]|nr:hypothetical protein [Bdellovibrionales bacterium]
MRELPNPPDYKKGDVLVVFGELFTRGYANGIVEEAQKRGMKVIYSTVGRRDENSQLRPLTADELKEKDQPLINVPLEAGFDMEPAKSGVRPVDQLAGKKLSEWDKVPMNFQQIEESRLAGIESFRSRVQTYMKELESHIPDGANVVFAHTMAGGVPRAKIVMPAMNRVFKGSGDRFASSEEFWNSDMGRFCALSFEEVTANTLRHLIDLSTPLRGKVENKGGRVSYTAYGYHGTDILIEGEYKWQSYSPYLQGFAKVLLEDVAQEYWDKGIKVSVFNAPEILTNSSSIFLGVEVSLYPLMGALKKEGSQHPRIKAILQKCQDVLKEGQSLDEVLRYTDKYFSSDIIANKWSKYDIWPQHNGPEQMALMRETSTGLIEMHQDSKVLLTAELSEVVFRACGELMLAEAAHPTAPVWWIGHDIVAKQTATQ